MTTSYTSLLGLALPVTGELQGTWGDTVNQQITELLDAAVAGTTTISVDADITLSTTTGAANQSRQTILLWTASGTTTRYITAPAQSKAYIVINKTGGTQSVVIRGVGPTTGVTVAAGTTALVAWNGTDFVSVASNTFIGSLSVLGTSTSGADIKLYEDTDNGTNYVGIKAPAAIAADTTWTLPNADGTNGQALVTNGTGTLSWTTITGGDVVGPASSTDNAFARFDGTTGKLIQNSTGATLDDNGAPTFTSVVNVSGTATTQGAIRLFEDTDNGVNYVAFQAPALVASNITWTLPNADGLNGQALITNGSGTLSWTTAVSQGFITMVSAGDNGVPSLQSAPANFGLI